MKKFITSVWAALSSCTERGEILPEPVEPGPMVFEIYVEEEYGYRDWIWTITATDLKEVEQYFYSVVGQDDFYCSGTPSEHLTRGTWKELDHELLLLKYSLNDVTAHIHQQDDSVIRIAKGYYR